MQLWGRIEPKLLELSRYHKRRVFGGNEASWRCPLLVGGRSACSGPRTRSFLETWRGELFVPFRGFAAPVQAKPKPELKATSGPRINKAITAPFVRLVTDEGHAVVSKHEALQRAMKLKLDLVEVQRTANPPVCKLMDFHREKYKQQMKEKERVKGKSELLRKGDCKEVRFTTKTEQKDLQMKADMTKRLMERGYRVKCMAMGNEDQDLGSLLSRLAALIEDVSFVESGPRVEKRQAYMIVRHAKFGPSKSKSGQKAAKVANASSSQASASPSSNIDVINTGPDLEIESESETETEYDVDDDGTKGFASADVEEIDSEFGDRVPWSDFNVEDRSPASEVNTEFGSKEVSPSIPGDDLPDARLFSKDASNGSNIAAIDEILAGVDNSISSESGRFKDPVRSSSSMTRSMENNLLNGQIHSSRGIPQLKPPNEVFGQHHLAGTQHDSSTVGRSMHAKQNITKTVGGLRSGKKPLREESVLSGLTNSHRSESPTISADSSPQVGYGIFSASKNIASGNESSQAGKGKNMASGSSVTSGMPDSNNINANKYKSRPETESTATNVRDNGKAREGQWGIFSWDSSNSNQQRSSRDG